MTWAAGLAPPPTFLAERFGCRVVGVDLHRGMIERSRERAERLGLANQLEFKVADVQALPFDDDTFDAVIAESVIAFAPDKPLAVAECRRVVRPGGYVGFNEGTWLTPPSSDLLMDLLESYGTQEVCKTSRPKYTG